MPLLDTGKIKKLREGARLSQADAAKKAGIGTRQRWHGIESGANTNIELDTLERVAKALGVKAKDLLK
jgi:transcriptional regulator with XRE-family HTH domain